MSRRNCVDCQSDTFAMAEYYMVFNTVWESAGMGRKGMLCIGCLEGRLGRTLQPADFTAVPCNWLDRRHSPRLRDRLRGRK